MSPAPRVAILQTGRLGDIWLTLPLADHLHQQGIQVDCYYDARYGNPFSFTPYVNPKPVVLPDWIKLKNRWGYALNEAIHQARLLISLKRRYSRVIWRQTFPYRWLKVAWDNRPGIRFYDTFPEISRLRAPTTLDCSNDGTILLFCRSQSVRFVQDARHHQWIEDNLQLLVQATGYAPIHVAFGNEPDHPKYPTWRGNLDDYQRLIAKCGLVYGITTSAHAFAQLTGKANIHLHGGPHINYNRIGNETAWLYPYDRFSPEQLVEIRRAVGL